MNETLIEMFLSIQCSDSINLVKPVFSLESVSQAINSLALSIGKSSSSELLRDKSNRTHEIIFTLHEHFVRSHRIPIKSQLFNAFSLLIDLLDDKICIPSVIRSVIHFLLQVITSKPLRSSACDLLRSIYFTYQDNQSYRIELGKHLKMIVSNLVPHVVDKEDQMEITQRRDSEGDPIFSLLEDLLINNTGLDEFIQDLDPFPELNVFQPLQERYLELRGTHNVVEEIKRFLDSSAVDVSLIVGLSQLSKQIKENKREFLELLENDKDGTNTKIAKELYSRLVHICTGQFDADIKNRAGECLGELGLTVCGLDSQYWRDGGFVKINNEFQFERIQLEVDEEWSNSNVLLTAKVKTLYLLNEYITDKNVNVMKTAVYTLKNVLATISGRNAYRFLNDETQILLRPFYSKQEKKKNNYNNTYSLKQSNNIWDTDNISHSVWVKRICCALISDAVQDEFFRLCGELCLKKTAFAEQIFPFLLFDIATNYSDKIDNISQGLRRHVISNTNNCSSRTISLVISALNFLRRHRKTLLKHVNSFPKTEITLHYWKTDYCFQIDYIDLAKAALHTNDHYSALMYLEASCERGNVLKVLDSGFCFEQNASEKNRILLDIYSSIHEPDSIYGINHNYGVRTRMTMHQHQGDWIKALGEYDVLLGDPSNSKVSPMLHNGIINSLQKMGNQSTLKMYLRGIDSDELISSNHLIERVFENAWRNCAWDMENTTNKDVTLISTSGFHSSLFRALKSLMNGDSNVFWTTYRKGISLVVNSIASGKNLYPSLARLQMLSELTDIWSLLWGNKGTMLLEDLNKPSNVAPMDLEPNPISDNSISSLKQIWKRGKSISFDRLEPILALREVLLKIMKRNDQLVEHICDSASLARKSQRFEMATSLLHSCSKLPAPSSILGSPTTSSASSSTAANFQPNSSSTTSLNSLSNTNAEVPPEILLEEAKVLWKQGNSSSAINVAKFFDQIISQMPTPEDEKEKYKINRLHTDGKVTIGKWLSDTRSENAQIIIDDYLKEAVDTSDAFALKSAKTYFTFGKYLDGLYQDIQTLQHSEDFKLSQQVKRGNKELAREYEEFIQNNTTSSKSKDIRRKLAELKKIIKQDEQEDTKRSKFRSQYLHQAIENYAKSAVHSDKYDIWAMFRVCSLWFENSNDEAVSHTFYENCSQVPSRKFIPLMYQIASRMGSSFLPFNKVLTNLLKRIAKHHPYHSLLQIYALKNGDIIDKNKKGSEHLKIDQEKIKDAKNIVSHLNENGLSNIINDLNQLVNAYIELAHYKLDPAKYKNCKRPVSMNRFKLKDLGNLVNIPVATESLPIDPEAKYEHINYIQSFEKTFSLAGGVNLPKIVKCIGANGHRYRQLVKGQDDLRQDAVMEQIFELVNSLLSADKETSKRGLRVRTYKVIPMTPTAGILGWVENTMPLGQYLIGDPKNCAHARYRPQDWSNGHCRKKMYQCTIDSRKLSTYIDICNHFKPVLHHFFLENFHDPSTWFEKRLAYTRSVASNSIVGYIIGLGDRHSQNILLDKKTAEVVHIDLGVAFDQGKLLPVPERIPFRLTRDIVDGFGVNGTEGVFRRCSECTMNVLRRNTDLLATVVEVFIHDPLFSWALSPLEAAKKQPIGRNVQGDSEESEEEEMEHLIDDSVAKNFQLQNKDAARAILRVKEKLKGYENGGQLSVAGQVNMLINQAQDQNLLSRLFHGWAPWV